MTTPRNLLPDLFRELLLFAHAKRMPCGCRARRYWIRQAWSRVVDFAAESRRDRAVVRGD